MQRLRWVGLIGLSVLLSATGCSGKKKDEGPPTFPVAGKIAYSDGTAYKGGVIEFNSTTDTTTRALGMIGEDGTFALRTTTIKGDSKAGAVAGEYRATITPHMGNQQEGGEPPRPFTLPDTYTVKEQDNQINIVIKR